MIMYRLMIYYLEKRSSARAVVVFFKLEIYKWMTHASDDTTAHNLGISAAEQRPVGEDGGENEAKVIRIPITRRHASLMKLLITCWFHRLKDDIFTG